MQRISTLADAPFEAWLRGYLREEHTDPPYDTEDFAGPEDFVTRLVREGPPVIAEPIRRHVAAAIVEATMRSCDSHQESRELLHGANIARANEFTEILTPTHHLLLMRGHTGVKPSLHPDAERSLLRLLVVLHPVGDSVWASFWEPLWKQEEEPDLWAIASAGLRRADPERALRILPLAIARHRADPAFSLANLLAAVHGDPAIGPKGMLHDAIQKLSTTDRKACRAALERVRLPESEIRAVLGGARPRSSRPRFVDASAAWATEVPSLAPMAATVRT